MMDGQHHTRAYVLSCRFPGQSVASAVREPPRYSCHRANEAHGPYRCAWELATHAHAAITASAANVSPAVHVTLVDIVLHLTTTIWVINTFPFGLLGY